MRRLALPLIWLLLLFLGMSSADPCDAAVEDCPPACHFSCFDGCATAPIGGVADSPQAGPAEPAGHLAAADGQPLDFSIPPDYSPPRA